MADGWKADKASADVFMEEVKKVLGPVLLIASSDIEDQRENTDLRVLCAKDQRIAVRIRKMQDFEKYQHQFTIRKSRDSGAETELDKISNGWGDWFFYGWGDHSTGKLQAYRILNLAAFRQRLIFSDPHVTVIDKAVPGGATLRAYLAVQFPRPCVVREDCRREHRALWTKANP